MLESAATPRLLKKVIRHPLRAVRRLVEEVRYAQLDETLERDASIAFLSNAFDTDVQAILEKHKRSSIRAWLERRRVQLNDFPGPYRLGAMPSFDCETIYLLVRSLKPETVVETGVCYGASSAYILHALAENRRGVLYSIDLGNATDEPPSDYFIPPHLKERWRLIIGDARQQLPRLLARLGRIDLFHHDSLHTYKHMMWEYRTAFRHLNANGVLSSHDVRTIVDLSRPFRRNPFSMFCEGQRLRSVVSRNVGIAMRSPPVVRRRDAERPKVRAESAEARARTRARA